MKTILTSVLLLLVTISFGQQTFTHTSDKGNVKDNLTFIDAKGLNGSGGKPTTESYAQYNSTNFVTMRKYGDGGACMYNPNAIHAGTFFSYNTVTLANISFFYPPSNVDSGTGGGGGNTLPGSWGSNGGGGLAAISW